MKNILVPAALIFLLITASYSQPKGYNLLFNITGLHDTTVFLAYYNGESTYIKDTVLVNGTGAFRFEGKEPLPQGVYFLAMGSPRPTRLFEFVIGETPSFSMTTDAANYVQHMKVSGDVDNKLFFEHMRFNMERNKEAEPYFKTLRDSSVAEIKKKKAREEIKAINEKVLAFHDRIITQHPRTLTARILKANRPMQIPDPPKRDDGNVDSTFQLRWYRAHFFDNFDLADDALLRMPHPIYRDKMIEYLDKLWAPHPDTLIKALNNIISKANKNKETYKYAVFQSVVKFQNPEIMGLDEVFIYLNDQYFVTGEMNYWANATLRKNMSDHAERLRKSLIGQKGANLIMLDANLKPKALYDIKRKYTVLYIFDPDCGLCKKETPKLVEIYNRKKFDLEVYAVSAYTSMAKMRNYIKEAGMKWITVNGPRTYVEPYSDLYDSNSTPTVYVMDSEKKIIAKKIPVDKIEEFLIQHEKIQRRIASKKSQDEG